MKSWLIAGVALVAAAPLLAQDAPQRAPGAQGMGKSTTRVEAETKVREEFGKSDTNRDGFVTRDEISAQVEARMAEARNRRFDTLDANKDGRLTREEFNARPQREARIERRLGGVAGNEKRIVRIPGVRSGGGGGMGGGLMIAMADGDRDGRISLKEAVDGTLARFDRADLNKDGTLTPQERREAFAQWGGRMREWGRGMRGQRTDAPPPPPPPAG